MKTGLHPTHGQRLGLKPMLEPVDDTLAPRDLSGIVSATPIPTFNSGVVLFLTMAMFQFLFCPFPRD